MRRILLLVTLLAVVGLAAPAPAGAYPGAPWFKPGERYTENFPDPSVLYDPSTGQYYAYATPTGGAYLPVMSSADASIWVARDAYPAPPCAGTDDLFYNDALPCPSPWAPDLNGGRLTKSIWAPGVARIGSRWVLYYAARVNAQREEFCLAVATADNPLGPFTDVADAPFLCDRSFPNGIIDPQPFVDPATGTPYLIWKTEGRTDGTETEFRVQQLTADGTSFAGGTSPTAVLATTDGSWEGDVIESPTMVPYGGRWLLFYSANEWTSRDYATGVAFCDGPLGPCFKSPANPILRSSGDVAGPGGPSAFVDGSGSLRLAYHSWREPYVGYPADPGCDGIDPDTHQPYCVSQGQRRLRVDYVSVGSDTVTVSPTPPAVVEARSIDSACPPATTPPAVYVDVDRSSGAARAIDCITWWGITTGSGAGTYTPAGSVNREQMASFVARLIDATDVELPAGADAFDDDSTSGHQDNINRLAAAGIVSGTGNRTYSPQTLVSRAQMATFLVRAAQFVLGHPLSAGNDAFGDDGGTGGHQGNINAAAAAGIATGTGPGAFSPNNNVSRAQMASFLARLADLLVDEGQASPPL